MRTWWLVLSFTLTSVATAQEPQPVDEGPPLAIPAPTPPPAEAPPPTEPALAVPEGPEPSPPVTALLPDRLREPIGRAVYERGERRKKVQLAGSISLLTWSVANLGVGAGGWALAEDPRWRAFHRANLLWNTVNVAIAIPSVLGAAREDPGEWSLGSLMDEDRKLLLAYGVNTGLDVGYVFAGAFLHEYGRRIDNDDLVGTGWSLMVQGGYLFVYDLVMWLTHAKGAKKLRVMPQVGEVMGIQAIGTF